MNHRTSRPGRAARIVALSAVAAVALSGCAAGEGTDLELSDEPVTLSFTWWGNDTRQAITQEVIDAFETEHPNITIEPQFTDWTGYWDKLSTSVAAQDTPDIIQMDEKFISTYASNGVLLDLGGLGEALPLDDFSETVLATGAVDGTQYAVPTSVNSFSFVANKTLLDQYGIELPDDDSWTWDDFSEWSASAAAKTSADGVYAVENWGFVDGSLHNWLRQNGDSLYNEDGEVVVDEQLLADWWQTQLDLQDSGVTPTGDVTVEFQGGVSESLTGTNKALMGPWWSNQVQALQDASGSEMIPLKLPTVDGSPEGSSYLKTSMYWAGSSKTEHPAEVALFLDYLANSEAAADLLQTERGVPANTKIREYITPTLDEVNTKVMDFVNAIEEVAGDPLLVPPPGGAAIETVLSAQTQNVLFGKETPKEAAAKFVKDMKQAIDDAK